VKKEKGETMLRKKLRSRCEWFTRVELPTYRE